MWCLYSLYWHSKCQNVVFVLLILAFRMPKWGILNAKKEHFKCLYFGILLLWNGPLVNWLKGPVVGPGGVGEGFCIKARLKSSFFHGLMFYYFLGNFFHLFKKLLVLQHKTSLDVRVSIKLDVFSRIIKRSFLYKKSIPLKNFLNIAINQINEISRAQNLKTYFFLRF